MATLQGKAVKNTYRQVLQIGANNVGVSGSMQPVQDGAGVNTALSLSTAAATINGTLTITGDLIITGGGIQIQDLIDDTVASLIQNGTGITWAYNDTNRTLTPTITIATADGGVQGDFLQLNVNANEASAVGKLKWNTADGTMDIGLMGGNVVLQVGQEQVARVLNNSGTNFTEAGYQAVKITSAQGQRLAVGLAQANNEANSKDTLGLVTENISNNQEGFVTTSGLVRQIDTTGDIQTEVWVDGDTLYLSPTVPGRITKVKPLAPNQTVIVGFVVYAHKTQGKIFVKVDNGYELNELHDVRITSVANNNILKYNSSLAVWENVAGTTTNIAEGTNLYYTQGRFDSAFAAKSTTNLAEGTNLYYTQARFDTAFSNKSTTNLAEGSNLYYTQARFNSALAAKTTTDLAEGSNLYYTDTRARLALSSSATGLSYANNSGVFTLTAGYAIPTSVKLGQYDTAYNRSIVSAAVSGTGTKTLSLTQQDANVVTATWTDLGITTINGTANQILATTAGNTTTIAFTNDVTMPNNLVVSGNLTINGTATYVNTQSISAKDPLFEVANDNNTTDAVDIGYYGRYYDTPQTRVEFTGLFRDASDAGKFKFFTGLVDEPTNVVNTTGTGYTVGTLVANFEGNLAGTANAANALSTARTIAASGDAVWSVSFDGSANVSSALTLANTGVTASTYGTSTAVPTIAVDSKGRITSASNTNITFPVTTVNGQAGTVVLTTTNVAEGSNQYFTSARAQSAITGGASSVVTADLTASRALVSDGTGKIAASASTTATEIGYVAGVTSAIQTQLNTKALDSNTVHITGTETITGAKTFSAALSGTSATFSDRVFASKVINSATITNSTNNASLLLYAPTTTNYYGGIIGWAEGNLAASISAYDDGSGGALGLSFATGNNASISERLKISSTGAATFSSSITANAASQINGLTQDAIQTIFTIQGYNAAAQSKAIYFQLTGSTPLFTIRTGAVGADAGIAIRPDGTNGLTIPYGTGAATFSGLLSVNGQYVQIANASNPSLYISNTTVQWQTYVKSNSNYAISDAVRDVLTLGYNGSASFFQGCNVGIGTSSPEALLHVNKSNSGGEGGYLYLDNPAASATGNKAGIKFGTSTGASFASIPTGEITNVIDDAGSGSSALTFGTFNGSSSGERMRITSGGNVTIGSTTALGRLNSFSQTAAVAAMWCSSNYSGDTGYTAMRIDKFDNNVTTSQVFINFSTGNNSNANGQINGNGAGAVAFGSWSDKRLKENIVDLEPQLNNILSLRPVEFDYIESEGGGHQTGFIAQEMQEVYPDAVGERQDGMLTVTGWSKTEARLVKAIQEQQAQIEELKALIAAK